MSSSCKSMGQEIKAAIVRSEPSVSNRTGYQIKFKLIYHEIGSDSQSAQKTRLLVSFSIASKFCCTATFSS